MRLILWLLILCAWTAVHADDCKPGLACSNASYDESYDDDDDYDDSYDDSDDPYDDNDDSYGGNDDSYGDNDDYDHDGDDSYDDNGGSLVDVPTGSAGYRVIAFNDLGMHCADQDFRIFSILPPYNVINAQVIARDGKPELMTPADGISLTYKAVAGKIIDVNDDTAPPIADWTITKTNQNDSQVYKTNFWEIDPTTGLPIGFLAYEGLYPDGVLAAFPFEPDLGLPAPNLEKLYLGDGQLEAEQAAMPGKNDPTANEPQPFKSYYDKLPFFVNFPFGYTVEKFRRYAAEGIPTGYIDDAGRTNPYPLMRVEARNAQGEVVAHTDVVTPVASEADCAMCHASQSVCDWDPVNTLVCDDIANSRFDLDFIEDASQVIGETREQQVINAAKINILKLHDRKHNTRLAPENNDGTNQDGTTPNIVCANCHYSPALDLAHLGPNNDNGKEQTRHVSMSRAMHYAHGMQPKIHPDLYGDLFPMMPPPDERDGVDVEGILAQTCYACHPGKRTKCLRGAMGGAGIVCQDCHGQMTQVGNDFSAGFKKVGYPQGMDAKKRIPWASEPTCQSCHIGDVLQVADLKRSWWFPKDVIFNEKDSQGNTDNLRLRMSYPRSEHRQYDKNDLMWTINIKASRFATDQPLYRLSKGHGGVACSGCHGSTHAIWPNKNPLSNDNKAAQDIQGHSGTIIECAACHEGDLGVTLKGPHGMHPVGNTRFAYGGHEDIAEHNLNACRTCHGQNGEGTVLSRTAAKRVLYKDDDGHSTITLEKGTKVSCNLCHSNPM